MRVITDYLPISTRGFNDIIDITAKVGDIIQTSGLQAGIVTVFVPGSTAGLTTIEFEPGLLQDLPEMFEKLAPMQKRYHHDETWHDGNGYAHVRSALTGTFFTVPFVNGRMTLGTWQQIVLLDFDNCPRQRQIVVQMMGE